MNEDIQKLSKSLVLGEITACIRRDYCLSNAGNYLHPFWVYQYSHFVAFPLLLLA